MTSSNIGRASFIFIDLAPHFPKANNMLDKIDEKEDAFIKRLNEFGNQGLNAMTISELTGIPRPTVVRKLKNLIDKKYLHINEKKLITFNAKDSAFITTKGMVNKNMISLSNFIYKVFNQIRIINT